MLTEKYENLQKMSSHRVIGKWLYYHLVLKMSLFHFYLSPDDFRLTFSAVLTSLAARSPLSRYIINFSKNIKRTN